MNSKLIIILLSLILAARVLFFNFNKESRLYEDGEEVLVSGVLQAEPKLTPKSQQFTVEDLLVILPRFPQINYGDQVELKGKVTVSEETPKMLFPQARIIENPNKTPMAFIFQLKQFLVKKIQKFFPEPEAGLLSGILLGYKAGLGSDFKHRLQNTGLTHVVVASGANLTFVATLVFSLALLIVGRRWANLLALPVIWLYAVMTGFEAAVVRAAIMVSFTYLARFLGREAGSWRGLVMAVYIMILFDPSIISNLGFQLSVAAMSGIIMATDFEKETPFRGVSLIIETMGAQLMTLPLIVGTFGRYGLLSLVTNLLTLWAVPFIMVLGLIALTGLSFPAQILLSYFVLIVEAFGKFDNLVLTLPQLDLTAQLGIYLIIIAVYVQRRIKKPLGRIRT